MRQLRNRTGTIPAVGPFHRAASATPARKPAPVRCYNKHIQVKCGERPGARSVVLAPYDIFEARSLRA